jgi:hypothetical protein
MHVIARTLCLTVLLLTSPGWLTEGRAQHAGAGYVPPEGMVPDTKTAIAIARVVLVRHYGERQVQNQQPLRATMSEGVWTVEGTLPPAMAGGVATIRIRRSDAAIIFLGHSR